MRNRIWTLSLVAMAMACARGNQSNEAPPDVVDAPVGESDEIVAVDFAFDPPGDPESVYVTGDFADWDPQAVPMSDEDGDGVWEVTEPMTVGIHAYKFVVNGTDWHFDPENPAYEEDTLGSYNSLIRAE